MREWQLKLKCNRKEKKIEQLKIENRKVCSLNQLTLSRSFSCIILCKVLLQKWLYFFCSRGEINCRESCFKWNVHCECMGHQVRLRGRGRERRGEREREAKREKTIESEPLCVCEPFSCDFFLLRSSIPSTCTSSTQSSLCLQERKMFNLQVQRERERM